MREGNQKKIICLCHRAFNIFLAVNILVPSHFLAVLCKRDPTK